MTKKPRAPRRDIVVRFTQEELEQHSLVTCGYCFHPPNNHYDYNPEGKRTCAHCSCKEYRQVLRCGKLVK